MIFDGRPIVHSAPKTIVNGLLPWLKAHAPNLVQAWENIPKNESLIDPNRIGGAFRDWSRLPDERRQLEGWVILQDGLAKVRFVSRSRNGWRFLMRPSFIFADLSRTNDIAKNEFTFLLPGTAFTAIRSAHGLLAEAMIVQAD